MGDFLKHSNPWLFIRAKATYQLSQFIKHSKQKLKKMKR